MKFTDKSIQALKPKAERYEIWDDGKKGFGIRVTPRGVKSFIWLYRFDGRSKRLTLGNYPLMSLSDAGRALAEAKSKLDVGIDPGTEATMQRHADRYALLIEELVQEYLERHAKPNKRSAAEDERILKKDILPKWGKIKAKNIKKADAISLLDEILERGAPIIANRTLACIRKMFNWANSRDLLEHNPCLSIKAPSKENHRDRVLTKEELSLFWNNLDLASMEPLTRYALKLQLVTAQRKAEILSAKWSHIDLHTKVWSIPAEHSKNGLGHRVPLPDLACQLLNEIKTILGASSYVFPSPRLNKSIEGSSIDHALRRNRAMLGITDVTPHDLRRTAASHMASLGVNRLVISKLLNHVDSTITAVYDRYSYDKEKKEALDKWGEYLVSVIKKGANDQE